MSDLGIDFSGPRGPGRRRAPKKASRLRPLIVILLVFGLIGYGAYWGVSQVSGLFGGAPEDYEGDGDGEVSIIIIEGDTTRDIANTLVDADVVASAEAFIDAARHEPGMTSIQPGTCAMRLQMSADAAVELLLAEGTCSPGIAIVIPEGWRVGQIVERLAENTHLEVEDIEAALDDPDTIGLPDEAGGNPEGYLFPARYVVTEQMSAVDVLREMTAATRDRMSTFDIEARAAELGYTTHELVTIASIVQREVRDVEDMPRVARVIYNRLDDGMLLQMDSTVHYATDRHGSVWTSDDDRSSDSPYNTYRQSGLPPGPIGAPGEEALRAALEPADGDWLYFVTVNLESGETRFAETGAGHQANVDELRQWCRETDTDLCS